MDCPSEEHLIRTALTPHEGVEAVAVDIATRSLTVWHSGDFAPLSARLDALNLGVSHVDTIEQDAPGTDTDAKGDQSNDVIANVGVIIAGGLVVWTGSRVPDLVIGALIGAIVLRGALRILGLSRTGGATPTVRRTRR